MLGLLVTALGCTYNNINIMICGKFVHGLGADCIMICKNYMIYKWFHKKKIAIPISIVISMSRLFVVLDYSISPSIVVYVKLNLILIYILGER